MMIGPALSVCAVRGALASLVTNLVSPSGAATLASLGIGSNGLCTILVEGTFTSVSTGSIQTAVAVDDGTISNTYFGRAVAAAATFQVGRALAGAGANATAGSVSAGVAWKLGMVIVGDGTLRVSLDGAAVTGVTGGATSGLTTLRFGNAANGVTPITGSVARARIYAGVAVSDAALPGLVTGY